MPAPAGLAALALSAHRPLAPTALPPIIPEEKRWEEEETLRWWSASVKAIHSTWIQNCRTQNPVDRGLFAGSKTAENRREPSSTFGWGDEKSIGVICTDRVARTTTRPPGRDESDEMKRQDADTHGIVSNCARNPCMVYGTRM
ncbi:hypothetical protein DFH09DRAFT_1099552 [Mycena vulgaris]|nr:hypothetical protein DFH09DRAFT_1099552 [Mycena vulgaris]